MLQFPNVLCTVLMDKSFCLVLHISLQESLKVSDQESKEFCSLTFSVLSASFSCAKVLGLKRRGERKSNLLCVLENKTLLEELVVRDVTSLGVESLFCRQWYRRMGWWQVIKQSLAFPARMSSRCVGKGLASSSVHLAIWLCSLRILGLVVQADGEAEVGSCVFSEPVNQLQQVLVQPLLSKVLNPIPRMDSGPWTAITATLCLLILSFPK